MTPDDIPELDRMCGIHPEAPVIIDHLAGIQKTDQGFLEEHVDALCNMARHKRVMLKVGVIHDLGFTEVLPLIDRVVAAFSPERCMWESDSGGSRFLNPERDYIASIDVIREYADFLSESDKEQILYRTAEDFFFIRL